MRCLHPIAGLVAAVMLYGCGAGTVQMINDNDAPAARGAVKVHAKNANVRLTIQVQHLAIPASVAPGATVYVVWAQPVGREAPPQNIGVLSVNPKTLEGSLQTVTPLHSFDLMITPEPQGAVQAPSRNPVLSARINAT